MGLPLLDLINEGNTGLMHAVERYDPAKGAKVSTYASWWIKQAVRRALSNQSRTIRLPVHIADKMSRLHKATLHLSEQLGREPTDVELASHEHVSAERIALLRTFGIRPASLDEPIGDGDDNRFGDIVEDESAQNPHELLRAKAMREEIREHINHLSPREAEVLILRFGIDGQGARTLEAVGRKFKVTRERIRQIQEIALAKLRGRLERMDPYGWKSDHGN